MVGIIARQQTLSDFDETSSDFAKRKEKLTELLTERRTNNGTSVKSLQENSPRQRRTHKMGLMRSLSSNSEATKEIL